jgi:hypothetical protein
MNQVPKLKKKTNMISIYIRAYGKPKSLVLPSRDALFSSCPSRMVLLVASRSFKPSLIR